MDTMAVHGNGTWDHGKKGWKLRTKELRASATVAQLRAIFKNPDIPASEDGSRPYWRKYLKAVRNYQARQQGKTSPLQERIRTLEAFIADFRLRGRDTSALEAELLEARQVSPDDIDHGDGPAVHPDMRAHAEVLDAAGELTEIKIRVLNDLAPKPIPKTESLRAEIDAYVNRDKAKGGKGWFVTRQYLNMFFEVTGDIPFRDITVSHYREFIEQVNDNENWGQRTKANVQQCLHMFLRSLEADHDDVRFPFVGNSKYRIKGGDGQKVQWTLDQVKTALTHATGDARLMLLMGLNCGFYTGDVMELAPEHFDGTHINKHRAKNRNKPDTFVASWLVWEETKKVMSFGKKKWPLEEAWRQFRDQHDLPEHSDLRKTVAQWIEDSPEAGGEQVARLFRCEKAKGNHGRFYSKFTPAQRDMLDKALRFIEKKVFGPEMAPEAP